MTRELSAVFARCAIASLLLATTTMPLFAQPQAPQIGAPEANGPGYLVVLGRSLDRNKIIAYSATLPPIYAETGGRYIGIGRPGGGVTCVYGLCEGRSAVIARWADQKSIEAFWWGDSYRKAIRLRDGAGVFTVVGLKATTNITPYEAGALLIGTMFVPNSSPSNANAALGWIEAAQVAGARLLTPFSANAIVPLEGDPPYNRVILLSFESNDRREAFTASAATKLLLSSSPPLTVVSLIAVNAPPSAPTTPPPSTTTAR